MKNRSVSHSVVKLAMSKQSFVVGVIVLGHFLLSERQRVNDLAFTVRLSVLLAKCLSFSSPVLLFGNRLVLFSLVYLIICFQQYIIHFMYSLLYMKTVYTFFADGIEQ